VKKRLARCWAGSSFGIQLCALQNRAWLSGNMCSKSTCCSERQGKCFGSGLAGSQQQSAFPTVYCMVSLCCLRTRMPDFTYLQKPLCHSSLSLHVWDMMRACWTLCLVHTDADQVPCPHQASLRDFQCLQWVSGCCQTHAAVPWELELAVALSWASARTQVLLTMVKLSSLLFLIQLPILRKR